MQRGRFLLLMTVLLSMLLGIQASAVTDGRESEYNDEINYADRLPLGGSAIGEIGAYEAEYGSLPEDEGYTDKDYYEFTLAHDGVVSLSFEPPVGSRRGEQWGIEVFKGSTKLVVQTLEGGTITQLPRLGLPAGTYYVQIYGKGYAKWNSGEYRLSLQFEERDDWELEPNNKSVQATVLVSDQTRYGVISKSGDSDYFVFSYDAESAKRIRFVPVSAATDGKTWLLDIVNGQDESVLGSKRIEVSTEQELILSELLVESGDYYFVVSANGVNSTEYAVSLQETHVCKTAWVDEVSSTCVQNGTVEHFRCEVCGACYDKNGNLLQSLLLPLGEHVLDGEKQCMSCEFAYPRFVSASLTIEKQLAVNFKLDPAQLEKNGFSQPYVVFSLNGRQTMVESYRVDENGRYVFSFGEISPRMMNDEIVATLYATYEGDVVECCVKTYSIREYCCRMLEKCGEGGVFESDAELKTLLVDLLCYGAASQRYLGDGESELVTSVLTEEQLAFGTQTTPDLNSVKNSSYETVAKPEAEWRAVGLVLEDVIAMRFKLALDSVEELCVCVRTDDPDEVWWFGADELAVSDGACELYFDRFYADRMRDTVYVTAYRNGVVVSHTAAYSIESYAYAKQNDGDPALCELVIAMMKYGDSAERYAKKNG